MRTAAIKLGAALVAALVVLWIGLPYLRPLGRLLPNTKAMVGVTGEILTETEALQSGVAKVQANLAKVKQQDELLAQQYDLMQGAVGQLRRQEELAGKSRGLLAQTLEKERTTADLTARASQAAAGTMTAVNSNKAELNRLAAATVRVQSGSESIDEQMNGLLGELQESKINFAVIGRWKAALFRAIENWMFWR
ncbi:MAG TPA: hypothetical protein VNT01_14380 [Symbiobacteriaceae bacterium]|nr:hypothetical protein [Symbiobacteriaceae bacterium]